MSYWEHARPVRRVRAVDVDAAARAASDLLDEDGMSALTVRRLAARLGVAPASLYSRVEGVDDLHDLALDAALARDPEIEAALAGADVVELVVALYRHLCRHPWACRVIAARAPRGPAYLRFSERLCALLVEGGTDDPLALAYALSNLAIGSATTAPVAESERLSPVASDIAPLYARLHAAQQISAETVLRRALSALLRRPDAR